MFSGFSLNAVKSCTSWATGTHISSKLWKQTMHAPIFPCEWLTYSMMILSDPITAPWYHHSTFCCVVREERRMHCVLEDCQISDKYVDADNWAEAWVTSCCCAHWLYLPDSIRVSGLHPQASRCLFKRNHFKASLLSPVLKDRGSARRKAWCKSFLFSDSLLSWPLFVLLFGAVVFVSSRILFINLHLRAFIAPDASAAINLSMQIHQWFHYNYAVRYLWAFPHFRCHVR